MKDTNLQFNLQDQPNAIAELDEDLHRINHWTLNSTPYKPL